MAIVAKRIYFKDQLYFHFACLSRLWPKWFSISLLLEEYSNVLINVCNWKLLKECFLCTVSVFFSFWEKYWLWRFNRNKQLYKLENFKRRALWANSAIEIITCTVISDFSKFPNLPRQYRQTTMNNSSVPVSELNELFSDYSSIGIIKRI